MDSAPNRETVSGSGAANDAHVHTGLNLRGKHEALTPITIVGGLTGMLVGTLPAAIWVLIFGVSFAPLYMLMPLVICWGINSFKGYRGHRGVIMTGFFTILGFYLTLLSCQAASLYILPFEMLFLNLPLVTITLIGKSEALSGPVLSSFYIFPALFTLLGALLSYELLMHKNEPAAAPEPDLNTEPE